MGDAVNDLDLSSLPLVGAEFGTVRHEAGATWIAAGARTDAFVPPDGGAAIDRLPGLRLACPAGPWTLAIRTAPRFAAAFDAGALMLRTGQGAWAKLAFERSPDGRQMAVSVVTRGTSDDANGPSFAVPSLHLRACFTGTACAFHVSADAARWDLLRFFALPGLVASVDIVAQSPTGEGCTARFDEARFAATAPTNLRDGS